MPKPPAEKPYAYVIRAYGVPAKIGARVIMPSTHRSPREGVIVRKRSYDHYVHVLFDGDKHDVPVHPLDLNYPAGESNTEAGQ